MRVIICILLLLLHYLSCSEVAFAQSKLVPLPALIADAKRSILPVICLDSTLDSTEIHQGTAVVVGYNNKFFFLTCEHVLAIKDSLNKTLKYLPDIYLKVNNRDGSTTLLSAEIRHVDETLDFALLSLAKEEKNKSIIESLISGLYIKYIQPRLWAKSDIIKEGEPILYMGYPLAMGPLKMGIKGKNYPLSRTGIISQLVDGRDNFLIDGFVSQGHSGSPVFIIKYRKENSGEDKAIAGHWELYLAGIAVSFPKEYYKGIKFENEVTKSVLLNPGFTWVTSMDSIIPILNKLCNIEDG